LPDPSAQTPLLQLSPLVMKRNVLVWDRVGEAVTTAVRPREASTPARTAGKSKVRIRIGLLSLFTNAETGNGQSPSF
jgi:hypothetical protein